MCAVWIEPDYYERFACKCGACRNMCCTGWEIDIGMKDYYRLIGLECSETLHRKIECAFADPLEPSPRHFKKIAPNWYGECPFLGEDRLCMLQKECGAEQLPEVCRLYPRSIASVGGKMHECCSASCEAVVELLCRREPLRFIMKHSEDLPELTLNAEQEALDRGLEAVRYMQDRALPLEERIRNACRLDAPALHYLRHLPIYAESSENFKSYADEAYHRYTETPESYEADRQALLTRFPAWECWLENLLINHLIYIHFPLADERLKPEDSVYGLHAAYHLLNIIAASRMPHEPDQDALTDAVSAAFHLIEHTYFYYNAKVLSMA